MMCSHKTLIFVPTYNEAQNIRGLFDHIAELELEADILFLDDASPDGTGAIIDEIARKHPNVFVIHRAGKLGIGSAHQDGIRWAYDHNYAVLITMDSDGTHAPEYLKNLLHEPDDAVIISGSRYLAKDSMPGWSFHRRVLNAVGHWVTSVFLRLPYDASGSFRLYRLDRLSRGIFDLIESRGYSFFFESLFILNLNGCTIREIPIALPARAGGRSKMVLGDVLISLFHLLRILWRAITRRESLRYTGPLGRGIVHEVPVAR